MPKITIHGSGISGAGATGGTESPSDPIFAAFKKWLRTGAPGDLDALVSESAGRPSVARFFGLASHRGGVAGAPPQTPGAAPSVAMPSISRPLSITVKGPPAGNTTDPRIAQGIERLAEIETRILSATIGESSVMRKLAGGGGGGLRWISGPPVLPSGAATSRATPGFMTPRWISHAPTPPGSIPPPPRPAPAFVTTGGGGWINGPPRPLLPPGPPPVPPPRPPFRLPRPHLGGIWSAVGGGLGAAIGSLIEPGAGTLAGAAIGAEVGRFAGGATRSTAALAAAGYATVLAGKPWINYSMRAMALSESAGVPFARWRGMLTPSLGMVDRRLAALGISPTQAISLLQHFPGYVVGSAGANENIIAALGRAKFLPGLSMLSPAAQESASSLAMRYKAFGVGSIPAGIAASQRFTSGLMTSAAVAGTSPDIVNRTIQSAMQGLSRAAPGPMSAHGIAATITPYFASGLGPEQASTMSMQRLLGPTQALRNPFSTPFRAYENLLLSQQAARGGLGSVIGNNALASLQRTTGGRRLIAAWRGAVQAGGASSPIAIRLMSEIMRTAYSYNPRAVGTAFDKYVAPAIGANMTPGLHLLAESNFLNVSPATLAFGSGPPLPSATVPRNNPLNIRSGPHGFRQFASIGQGFSAADKLLQRYASQYHLTTLKGIISRWAPPSENDTKQYIANISRWTGWKPNQPLDMGNPTTRAKLEAAMARQESGLHITSSQILADEKLRTTFGAAHMGSAAPGSVVSYIPRAEGLTLGASRVMAAAGQKTLAGAGDIAQALGSLDGALSENTAATQANTEALKAHEHRFEQQMKIINRGAMGNWLPPQVHHPR